MVKVQKWAFSLHDNGSSSFTINTYFYRQLYVEFRRLNHINFGVSSSVCDFLLSAWVFKFSSTPCFFLQKIGWTSLSSLYTDPPLSLKLNIFDSGTVWIKLGTSQRERGGITNRLICWFSSSHSLITDSTVLLRSKGISIPNEQRMLSMNQRRESENRDGNMTSAMVRISHRFFCL